MAVKVLLDVNIFQDVISGRPGVDASSLVIDGIVKKRWIGFVAATSVPILWYVNRKDSRRREKIKLLLEDFEVVPLTGQMIQTVLNKELFGDLEDELQYLATKQSKANYFITRNIHDFSVKDINIVAPEEFLTTLR